MGNLDSLRDWGHARDYVEMQWRMLQQETPEDFVIATGARIGTPLLRTLAQALVGHPEWEGSSRRNRAPQRNGEVVIRIDPRYFRPRSGKPT